MKLFEENFQGGVIILDFGSQFTQLIARRFREMGVHSQILPYSTDLDKVKELKPKGLVLSGGPHSVYAENSPRREIKSLLEIAPVLGICYGLQLYCYEMGGEINRSNLREYGDSTITWTRPFINETKSQKVWMSHGDKIQEIPTDCELLASSENHYPAVVLGPHFLGLQFHPEVEHTQNGRDLLRYFVFEMCGCHPNWSPGTILKRIEEGLVRKLKNNDVVLCALSGGVDSAVVATLLTKVLGRDRVKCVFVDTGLLRKNEYTEVLEEMKKLGLDIKGVLAKSFFMEKLKGVSDPEKKRKIIGHAFIDVFKDEISSMGEIDWLAQGTLYPDVIESVSPNGQSVTIKSHHNVGGLPDNLNLKLLEPVRELFKDEVRALGEVLRIPSHVLERHPFPGPGLAIRILGEITESDVSLLQEVDFVFINMLKEEGLYSKIWQAFAVLLPIYSVGSQGDGRTYERVVALRAVTSVDGMTADWYDFEPEIMKKISNKITNSVPGVNRVVYDITSKPPGTIEWE